MTCPLCLGYQPSAEVLDASDDHYCERHRLFFTGPRATGNKETVNLDITGYIFPWVNGGPFTCQMPGSEFDYLPCFRHPDNLARFMRELGASFDTVKLIVHGGEFLDCVPPQVRVILEPSYTDKGTIRYTLITLAPSSS